MISLTFPLSRLLTSSPRSGWTRIPVSCPPPPLETSVFLSSCGFIAWICSVWTNWMFIFVSSVLIGGSHSLPLASWLTFGLSCILALLYRWWELPRAPSVCSVTDAAPAFALLPPSLSSSSSRLSVLHSLSFYPFSISSFLLGWSARQDLCPSPRCFL